MTGKQSTTQKEATQYDDTEAPSQIQIKDGELMDKKAYSVAEAATTIGISRTTLYELIKAGQIHTLSIGAKTLVPAQALEDFVDFYYRNGNLEVHYE